MGVQRVAPRPVTVFVDDGERAPVILGDRGIRARDEGDMVLVVVEFDDLGGDVGFEGGDIVGSSGRA
jgi:hypothetical protein